MVNINENYNPIFIKKNDIFNLTINIDLEPGIQGGIKSYEEYIEHVFGNGDKRGKMFLKGKIDDLIIKLLLKYGTYIDPIHFFIQLYYGEGLSIKDISKRLLDLGWQNKNINSLEKTFKLTFLWKLRDTTGSKISTKKRKTNGQINNARYFYNEKIEKKYEILKDLISNKVYKILDINNFNSEKFKNLNKNGKILYILDLLYGISKCKLKNLQKIGIGAKVIANFLNDNLELFFKDLGINMIIYPKNIQEIFNEN